MQLPLEPGVFLLTCSAEVALQKCRAIATSESYELFAIEGAGIDDKTSFLMQAAEAVRAPYESQNWDAFDEVLRDLEWAPAPGYVIVYTHSDRLADGAPAQFAIALDIFRSTVTSWLGTGIRMFVFLQSDGPHLAHDLPVHPC